MSTGFANGIDKNGPSEKFSQGPWSLSQINNIGVVIGADKNVVAEVNPYSADHTEETAMNARLVALAPEFYWALKNMVELATMKAPHDILFTAALDASALFWKAQDPLYFRPDVKGWDDLNKVIDPRNTHSELDSDD